MEWFRIKTPSLLVRVAVDEIVYVKADGNYCDLVLINGRSRKMTFQLHHFEDNFKLLHNADMFVRVGRSLIVNKQYVQVIDLIDQSIIFGGKHLFAVGVRGAQATAGDMYVVRVSRDALRTLKEQLETSKAD
ncbi:MAG: LytTR family transcriptional regulator [Muribaculaceae bacterium]|nr:LytTR family transcriptional regulator [Muribaculaceae bacterium]